MTTPNNIDHVGMELRRHWTQLAADDTSRIETVGHERGVDFQIAPGKVWETDEFIYLPVTVEHQHHGSVTRETVTFALADDHLVTLQPRVPFELFDKAIVRMRRIAGLATSPHGIMYALLWALNESSGRVVEFASQALEEMGDDVREATEGQDASGRQLGVNDMLEAISTMHAAEEILSRAQESQLNLARAARHLRAEVTDIELATRVDVLTADINGIKEHAGFEHEKVRFLQQSIMATLDVKQNEIVKVFTIITAVFLPPTLIATFYGMNFTNMPELSTQHGFLITTILTLVAAVIPLWYIRRRGWLR